MVKYIASSFLLLALVSQLYAQDTATLTLQKAYALAEKNYPVSKQSVLVQQTEAITIDNLSKGFLPQVSLNGQATYQSDVTKVAVPLPGFDIPAPSKDQYKLVADVSQLVYDGGVIRQQKKAQQLNADVEEQKITVELYKVKERINQVYLGILYLDEQLKQVALVKADIQTGIKRVEAQVSNGVSFRSNLNVLKAQFLQTDQHAIELKATRKGLIETLGLLLGQPLAENTALEIPAVTASALPELITRPELQLYDQQSRLLTQQKELIRTKNLPKASVFVQSGYARPALNLLSNQFDFYYIGGLRFNWSLGGLYTKKKEKELVDINKRVVDIQKETFLLNTSTELEQQQSDIEKWQQLVDRDNEIVDLRVQVKDAAKAQLENGVITANDYLREVNAEDQARQARITHQLQLLQAQLNYQTISGKQ